MGAGGGMWGAVEVAVIVSAMRCPFRHELSFPAAFCPGLMNNGIKQSTSGRFSGQSTLVVLIRLNHRFEPQMIAVRCIYGVYQGDRLKRWEWHWSKPRTAAEPG
jgi:hypothetical protein